MPEGYSQFFSHGEGARVWDVDGKEYIDFMCTYGPIRARSHCRFVPPFIRFIPGSLT